MHILLSRTAQIYLELQFCVEQHTEKSPAKLSQPTNQRWRSAGLRTDVIISLPFKTFFKVLLSLRARLNWQLACQFSSANRSSYHYIVS